MEEERQAWKQEILQKTRAAGFCAARILSPFEMRRWRDPPPRGYRFEGAPSLLVAALPYGNQDPAPEEPEEEEEKKVIIAPFARRNYYQEAVRRLQELSRRWLCPFPALQEEARQVKKEERFRVLCNSPVPEKPLALACGLGSLGRNGLVITAEAGSLVILAAMTLPWRLEGDLPEGDGGKFFRCGRCPEPPCVKSCPTGALRGDGTVDLERCIQWYASGNGPEPPPPVAARWGRRLYGCTLCQDACVHNLRPIPPARTELGVLPARLDPLWLLALDDDALRSFFKGTALGLSWLSPATLRRNLRLSLF